MVKGNTLFSVTKCLLVKGIFFNEKVIRVSKVLPKKRKRNKQHYEKLTSYHKDFSRKELNSHFIKD